MARTPLGPAARSLARTLTGRALHRTQWHHSSVALIVALLTGQIVIRMAANLLMAIDISARGGSVQAWQFAAAHGIALVALAAWTASRRVGATRAAVGHAPGLIRRPSGVAFERRGARHALFAHAAFVGPVGAGILLFVTAAVISPNPGGLLSLAVPFVLISLVLPPAVAFASNRLGIGDHQFETLQLIGLLAILAANLDVAPGDGGVVIVMFYRTIPAVPIVMAGLTLAAGLSPLVAALLLAAYDRVGRKISTRVPRSALLVWYRRITTGPWTLVYLVMLPVIVSENLLESSRRWIAFAVAVGVVGWFVGILGKMDQTLEYRRNRKLVHRGRFRILAPMMAVHLALALLATLPAMFR
jgi:hypothetical protein